MANVIGILFFVGIGFLMGLVYAYKQLTEDFDQLARRIIREAQRRR